MMEDSDMEEASKVVVDEEILSLEQRGEGCRIVIRAVPLAQVRCHRDPGVEQPESVRRSGESFGVARRAERPLMSTDRHLGLPRVTAMPRSVRAVAAPGPRTRGG